MVLSLAQIELPSDPSLCNYARSRNPGFVGIALPSHPSLVKQDKTKILHEFIYFPFKINSNSSGIFLFLSDGGGGDGDSGGGEEAVVGTDHGGVVDDVLGGVVGHVLGHADLGHVLDGVVHVVADVLDHGGGGNHGGGGVVGNSGGGHDLGGGGGHHAGLHGHGGGVGDGLGRGDVVGGNSGGGHNLGLSRGGLHGHGGGVGEDLGRGVLHHGHGGGQGVHEAVLVEVLGESLQRQGPVALGRGHEVAHGGGEGSGGRALVDVGDHLGVGCGGGEAGGRHGQETHLDRAGVRGSVTMYLWSTYKLLHADTEKIPQPMVAAFPALSLYTWPDLPSRAGHRQVGKQCARSGWESGLEWLGAPRVEDGL